MRVFVTGATGFVGTAIVLELINAGHEVVGLARSDASAASLTAVGAKAHRGDLQDLEALRLGAADADGVIHAGFIHDFSNFKANCEIDARAIAALAEPIAGSDRPLIVTSGTGLLMRDHAVTEDDVFSANSPMPRLSEVAAQSAAAHGVRAIIMRLPPSVHGEGDYAFVPTLIDLAKKRGVSAYIGDGQNQWPAIHRFDAAKLYRLALETPSTTSTYHAVAEEGVTLHAIAEAIGKGLNLPVVSKAPEEAAEHFSWFAHFAAMDNRSSSAKTRELLGWQPSEPGLLSDLDGPSYFLPSRHGLPIA
ncbi:SDR family oxidoreductase [Rhizobium sp.]|jgi:nucleoside-diphosphate-sugar epimerase|uniref:SDR family oxidoreductase n=1 Tax=Rhizobium sp. TaxID=391 RepID=UPI000E9A8CCD|nr:3-beta hydroxysteroid dehydrogenase [Rhizobium sp.]